MTDLRDQLPAFEAAAQRAAARVTPSLPPLRLTDRRGIGHELYRLRHAGGMSLDGLAARLGISRSGVGRRESVGFLPASALIEHAGALGYDLALIPKEPA